MPIAPNALTDAATVQARLRLAAGTDQALIEQLINEASAALEKFTGRDLTFAPAVTEAMAPRGGPKILVARTPLLSVASVTLLYGDAPVVIDPSEYEIHSADEGTIFRKVADWPCSARLQGGLNFDSDQQPGTERKTCTVVYGAGYVTGVQVSAANAGAWPGAVQGELVGKLICPAGQPAQVWEASVAGTTGGAEPAWPVAPVVGQTLVDGGVTWTFTGIYAAVGLAKTLPSDLERACVLAAVSYYREATRDPNIQQETVGKASRKYSSGDLPEQAKELALRYARWA